MTAPPTARFWRDGREVRASEWLPQARSVRLGDGWFETVRVAERRARTWSLHLARLVGAARLNVLGSAESLDGLAARATSACETALGAVDDGVWALRVLVYPTDRPGGLHVCASVTPFAADVLADVRLAVSPMRHPGLGVWGKSASRAWCETAKRLAQLNGADTALLLDDAGHVIETPDATVAWLEGEQWFTVPVAAGALHSTTVEALETAGVAFERALRTPEELVQADAVVLLSALRLAVGVSAVDTVAMPPGHGAAAAALREKLTR